MDLPDRLDADNDFRTHQVILAEPGANPANIFWQVGSSATIGTTSVFQGNIICTQFLSPCLLARLLLSGRALAIGGAVSVDTGGGTSATVPVTPTAPTVTSTTPANGAIGVAAGNKITATFSTAMNPTSISSSSFTLAQGTTPVSGSVTYVGTTATFAPSSALAPQKTYTGTITTKATDQSGNALAANYIWSFTTGAAVNPTNPTVISTAPSTGATGVSTASKLSASFSEAVDPSTLTGSTFTLTQGATAVTGTVTYTGTTATFTPAAGLIANSTYTATITTGVHDLAGNALLANYIWNFVTGTAVNTTPPTVTSTQPVNGTQSVTVGTNVTATFSTAMDPLTITTNTFTLQNGATAVAGTVTYSGLTATFTPSATLNFSTTYTATITNGARDLTGNALAGNYVWNFATAATPTPAPVITTAGTVNAASFTTPVVPGSIASVFGTNLTIGQGQSMVPTPLPTTIAQGSFTIGGLAAPIYFGVPTQVSVQIPWELAGQSQTTITATVNGQASNTETVPLAPFAPGIFTLNSSGSGQGAILVAPSYAIAAPGTPALRNGYISIFCTGLGAVTNQPPTGIAAPNTPLSYTLTTPTVNIGGIGAVVSYSGLAPGFAGLYQVNAIVPPGVNALQQRCVW